MFSHKPVQETRGDMVLERGVVGRDDGTQVLVFVQDEGQCESCDSRLDCLGMDGKVKEVLAVNDMGAKVGDLVEIGVSSILLLKVSFLVFFLPMMIAVAGGFLGRSVALFWQIALTPCVIIGVVLALLVAFIPIRFLEKRARSGDDFSPRVMRILNQGVACSSKHSGSEHP